MRRASSIIAGVRTRGSGFTLVELMITVSIIGIMASMVLFAYFGATEAAKEQKTKALIVKLDAIIKEKWDSYKTRRVPINLADQFNDRNNNGAWDSGEQLTLDWNVDGQWQGTQTPLIAGSARLLALRELMRMELPDRWSDVTDDPIAPIQASAAFKIARPAISQAYLRRYNSALARNPPPTMPQILDYQNAECLYQIVMAAIAEEGDSRDVFRPDDIADTDEDGLPEFVDGWKRPIRFLRWAPGFQDSELQIVARGELSGSTISGNSLSGTPGSYVGGAVYGLTANGTLDTSNCGRITGYVPGNGSATVTTTPPVRDSKVVIMQPDPFDPMGRHNVSIGVSFAIYPLIYSAGPDKAYGIVSDFGTTLRYGISPNYDNPFVHDMSDGMIGSAKDITKEPNYIPNAWRDNIHNHLLNLK